MYINIIFINKIIVQVIVYNIIVRYIFTLKELVSQTTGKQDYRISVFLKRYFYQ